MIKKLIALDTETSGLQPDAEILSLSGFKAVLDLEEGKLGITEYFDYYFNQDIIVPYEATLIDHLTNEILFEKSGGKYFEDYEKELQNTLMLSDYYVIGHNVDFDLTRLKSSCIRNTASIIPTFRGKIDTLPLTKKMIAKSMISNRGAKLTVAKREILQNKLGFTDDSIAKLVEPLGLDIATVMHSSLYDSLVTLMIFYVYYKQEGWISDEYS